MKVCDLFEGSSYAPSYDEEKGIMTGAVSDWLEKMGIKSGDKKFFDEALAELKKTKAWEVALGMGLKFTSTPRMLANGTLTFNQSISTGSFDSRSGGVGEYEYRIYGNGMIRGYGPSAPTRLKSPKPRMVANDPLKSMVKVWEGSLLEVTKKFKEKLDKMYNDEKKK